MFNYQNDLNYSIHTYELFTELSLDHFWQVYHTLKTQCPSIEKQKIEYIIYDSFETTEYILRKLPFYGINEIRLCCTDSTFLKCTLYIVANPYNAYMQQLYSDGNIIDAHLLPTYFGKWLETVISIAFLL